MHNAMGSRHALQTFTAVCTAIRRKHGWAEETDALNGRIILPKYRIRQKTAEL